MATVRFKFRASSVPETEGTLYYQVIHKRNVKWISTEFRVFPCDWNENTERLVIPPDGERKAELQLMQSIIEWNLKQRMETIHKLETANKDIAIDELCDAFKQIAPCKTVFVFLQEQVVRQEQMKRQGTAKTYGNAYRCFKKFRDDIDLTFENLRQT